MSQCVRARTHRRPGRDLARAAHDEGPLGTLHPKLRLRSEHGEQPREVATRLSDRPGAVTDEIWAEVTRHYDERQLEALVLMVAITNFFNRLNTTFRVPAGTSWD
jgi:alkylhydroperoxidase family enzyme